MSGAIVLDWSGSAVDNQRRATGLSMLGGVRLTERFRSYLARIAADEQAAELAWYTKPSCPVCGHDRDEQERAELEESLARWWRRMRGKPLRAARCGSTHRMNHVLTPCRCRHPFHGS